MRGFPEGPLYGWPAYWTPARFICLLTAGLAAVAAASAPAAAASGSEGRRDAGGARGCDAPVAAEASPGGDLAAMLQLSVNVSSSTSTPAVAAPASAAVAATAMAVAGGHAGASATGMRGHEPEHGGRQAVPGRDWRPHGTDLLGQPSEGGSAKEDETIFAELGPIPAIGTMIAAFFVGAVVSKSTNLVPETLCFMAVASVLGLIYRPLFSAKYAFPLFTESHYSELDSMLMNNFLLPIIIFESGWSCKLPVFVNEFGYIMIFAVFGTLLSTACIGYASWTLSCFGLHRITDLRTNLVFAALISATDPVATLANFAQLKLTATQPLLVGLVFGESIVNDAVAIVLFTGINSDSLIDAPWSAAEEMVTIFFGSVLLGVFLAAVSVLLMKVFKLTGEAQTEVFYIFLLPFLIYACANTLRWSGIIACLFGGIVFRLYGAQHLSDKGMHSTEQLLEVMTRLAEGIIFILSGIIIAFIEERYWKFCLIALVFCLVSRAIVVVVCGQASNAIKRCQATRDCEMITCAQSFMIWLSGLRGGVGLYLALSIGTWCKADDKSQIVTATFFCVAALLLMCGTLTIPSLEFLGLAGGAAPEEEDDRQLVGKSPLRVEFDDQVTPSRPVLRGLHQVFQSVLGNNSEEGAGQEET